MSPAAAGPGLAEVLGAIDEGVMVFAPGGQVVEVNAAAATILGATREELLASDLASPDIAAFAPDGRRLTIDEFPVTKAVRSGQRVDGQVVEMDFAGGRRRLLSCNVVPMRDAAGADAGVFCAFTDVTEQRRSQERFRTMIDRSLNIVALIDAHGVVTYVNAAVERKLGWLADDLVGHPAIELLHADDRAAVQAELADLAEADAAAARVTRRFDCRLATAGGGWRPFEVQLATAELDDGHRGVQVSAKDVTEHRRAEREVRRLSARLRALLDGLPIGIAFVDRDGGATVANPALKAIFGMPGGLGDEQERPVAEVLRLISTQAADPEGFIARLGQVVAAGLPVYDDEVRFADGRVALRDYVPIADDGDGALGHALLYRDVTAQRRAEEELRAVRDEAIATAAHRAEFLATMSHEIRTPLNGILGALELLGGTALDTEQGELAAMMAHAGASLRAIIDEILDFSRIEAGKLPVRERPFSVRAVLAAVRGVVAPAVDARAVEVTYAVDDDVPATVIADPDRVQQILLNLAGNAVKFTPAGSVRLHAGVERDRLVLSVRDTGPGIAPADRDHLFHPFAQADGAAGGSGLGLAITQRLVTLLGGTIAVESEPGHGATFVVRLPLRVAEGAGAGAGDARDAATGSEVAPSDAPLAGRALVADDNDINRQVLGRQLERLGLAVTTVADGHAAVAAAAGERFDVILMDCRMPGLDGYAAARQIRDAAGGANAATPILAVTANVLPEDRVRCAAAGMDGVVTKPIALDALRAALADVGTGAGADDAAAPPVIDTAALTQLRDELLDDALLATVIERYAEELDARATAIHGAFLAGDRASLAAAAHMLASPSATIGLSHLGTLCRTLEADADHDGAAPAFHAVQAEIARVERAIPELLALVG